MAILSEITELLRRWDVWKRVEAAPQRIDELEKRVAVLEARATHKSPAIPSARQCPMCDGEMKVIREREHEHFGFAGVKVHSLKCIKCGNEAQRNFEPGKGYK